MEGDRNDYIVNTADSSLYCGSDILVAGRSTSKHIGIRGRGPIDSNIAHSSVYKIA